MDEAKVEQDPGGPQRVVCLHGLGMPAAVMAPMAMALRRAGFAPDVVAYPSCRAPLPDLAETYLRPALCGPGPVHVVGHSLGGLLVRALALRGLPDALGRVVMCGTPNHGSDVVDLLARSRLFRAAFGPTGAALGTGPDQWPAGLPALDGIDVGVIAGTLPISPFARTMNGPNDGIVSVSSTRLDGADHVSVRANHSGMLLSSTVFGHVVKFLETGAFAHVVDGAAQMNLIKNDQWTGVSSSPVAPSSGRGERCGGV